MYLSLEQYLSWFSAWFVVSFFFFFLYAYLTVCLYIPLFMDTILFLSERYICEYNFYEYSKTSLCMYTHFHFFLINNQKWNWRHHLTFPPVIYEDSFSCIPVLTLMSPFFEIWAYLIGFYGLTTLVLIYMFQMTKL